MNNSSKDDKAKFLQLKSDINELIFIVDQKTRENDSLKDQSNFIQVRIEENNKSIRKLLEKQNELGEELRKIYKSLEKLKWKIKRVFIIGFLPFFPRKIVWISN